MKTRLLAATSIVLALVACTTSDAGPSGGNGSPIGETGPGGAGGAAGAGPTAGASSGGFGGDPPPNPQADVLFVVDNSSSMADKQNVLAQTMPAFLEQLTQTLAITDLHVGVVTSSLGGHGADACSPAWPTYNDTMNDRAHLISRRADGSEVPSYRGHGYFVWDPMQTASPPGDADLATVTANLQTIILGAGEQGCGFEAPLEAMYRFLVDPEPTVTLPPAELGQPAIVDGGADTDLLDRRAEFLRPRSRLVVVLLSDEDDCSIIDGPSPTFPAPYLVAQIMQGGQPFDLMSGTPICATDPDDPGCTQCYASGGTGCVPLTNPGDLDPTLADQDSPNLRCWDQKRRFGFDALYPVSRYVGALRGDPITKRDGTTIPNPLFAGGRTAADVVFAPIIGIPAVDVAADGSVAASEATDPAMIAATDPRSGVLPDGETLDESTWNAINGHEWRPIPAGSDLQFACIFDLPEPLPPGTGLDCADDTADNLNPLCEDPTTGAYDVGLASSQRRAKAFPGLRYLQVAAGLGAQATIGSVCSGTPRAPTYEPVLTLAAKRLGGLAP